MVIHQFNEDNKKGVATATNNNNNHEENHSY